MIDMLGGVSRLTPTTSLDMAGIAEGVAGPAAGSANPGLAPTSSFADVLQSLATDVTDNLRGAEQQSFMAVRGEAHTREVVDAMMTAERSLQTAIAIRDKIVTAYLEIARMQI